MSESVTNLQEIINKLPQLPGVYMYYDTSGKIIYIGKAKKLKNRVLSYFNDTKKNRKTDALVRKIHDIRYTVVETEHDALLLENNLIKKHKPKYNILLKDDKTYPWISIKKEPFPRVYITRHLAKDGSEYFGPYTSARFANQLMDLVKSLYKLRTCSLKLNESAITSGKFKVCLQYHIGNCLGPCVNKISEEEYNEFIFQVRSILKGNFAAVIDLISLKIEQAVDALQFEKAHELKQSLDALKKYRSKSTIVNASLNDIDVFSLIEDDRYAYINYLKIVQGAVNQIHSVEIERKLDEEKEELLASAIYEIRQLVNSHSKEVIVPFLPSMQLQGIQYVTPKVGDKQHLLQLSERNAAYFKLDRDRQRDIKKEDSTLTILKTIKNELKLPELPIRIECFDNSNIQGTNPVSSCVVFLNAKPAKKEYRKFHVKTVVGADDFASMEEVVYRRYKRVLEEGKDLPNLIVVDGGKGQLHAAITSLEKLGLYGKIPILGLAERLEEVYYPGDKDPYLLAKNSLALKTLMQIRDEAHRFAITFHKQLRSKSLTKSVLDDIKGIGARTEEQLIHHFKSIEKIKEAGITELTTVVGLSKAQLIYDYFHQ
ncbi:excinuclease ABC subunit UvrC [Porphyromonadaceae bacterium OttesenSCG-928-L07]|nr:excinuclease ABC subunit UvrC [Porphyromonadaceae bacterium OttesenSCG-928-L07]